MVAADQAAARTAIYNERLFEFAGEGKRRQDMIRYGSFTTPHRMCSAVIPGCQKTQTEPFRILFPIPQTQMQTNSLLVQNPGY